MRNIWKSPLFIALAAVVLCVLTESAQAFDHSYLNVWYKLFAKQIDAPEHVSIVSLDNGLPINVGSVGGSTKDQAILY